MPELLVRNVGEKTIEALRERAQRNKRSLQSEILMILEREAAPTLNTVAKLRALHRQIKKDFPKQTPSVEMIREDRDR